VIRLGDGTEQSARRMAGAVDLLHPYTDELFEDLPGGAGLPDRAALRGAWDQTIAEIFAEAHLEVPVSEFPQTGGRRGLHGEGLGVMLAEMQSLHRAHPGAVW